MNRSQRRAALRTVSADRTDRTDRDLHPGRRRRLTALGSAAVLASSGAGAALVLGGSGTAGANAPIVVDTLSIFGPGSLGAAIDQANTNPGEDLITFAVSGTITLDVVNLPTIYDAVHIVGPGSGALTIDGTGGYSALSFYGVSAAEGTSSVSGLTIAHTHGFSGPALGWRGSSGDLTVSDVVFDANVAAGPGGAARLYGDTGHVTFSDTTFSHNSAYSGGGLNTNNGVFGHVTVTIVDSTFDQNEARSGGGFSGTNTDLTITDTSFTGNEATYAGGGLLIGTGGATLTRVTVSGNSVTSGEGGGVAVSYYGSATFEDSTITGNTSLGEGGGIGTFGRTVLTLDGTTVSGNSAGGSGGGVRALSSTLTVTDSTIADNVAVGFGGGIGLQGTVAQITGTTISGNEASLYGGGVYAGSIPSGGVLVANSTISGNRAKDAAAAWIGGSLGGAALVESTVTDNVATSDSPVRGAGIQVDTVSACSSSVVTLCSTESDGAGPDRSEHVADLPAFLRPGAGSSSAPPAPRPPVPPPVVLPDHLVLTGTIVAGDVAIVSGEPVAAPEIGGRPGAGTITVDTDHSILGAVDPEKITLVDAGGTRTGVSAAALRLGPLADNGGPTRTHALLEGSPAIDAGPATVPTFPGNTWDQRGPGFVRVEYGRIDVGAFEVQLPLPPEPNFTG